MVFQGTGITNFIKPVGDCYMPLHYDGDVRITKVNMGPYDNNGYLLSCPETNEGILIDTAIKDRKKAYGMAIAINAVSTFAGLLMAWFS